MSCILSSVKSTLWPSGYKYNDVQYHKAFTALLFHYAGQGKSCQDPLSLIFTSASFDPMTT